MLRLVKRHRGVGRMVSAARWLLLPLLAAALLTTGSSALAGQATPTPDVPAPEECTTEPVTLEELQALVATPVAAMPAASPPATSTAVDAETEAAVRAVIRELIACSNAGDLWRVLALYSDRFIRQWSLSLVEGLTGEAGPMPDQIYRGLAGARPLPEGARISILSFGAVERLPDGRVAAIVVGDDPQDQEPAGPTRFLLVEQADGWRVDDFEDVPE
ncbi:MAG TPA: hypothetical protein VIL01_12605 [Thermomicrobiales bacterium]